MVEDGVDVLGEALVLEGQRDCRASDDLDVGDESALLHVRTEIGEHLQDTSAVELLVE